MSLHATSIDEVVTLAFFDAIRPAQLDALSAIVEKQQIEHKQLLAQWQDRLKRARYEAHLAERQYNAVDPDNRLVAATLEASWEEKLLAVQSVIEGYDRFEQTQPASAKLSPQLQRQLLEISANLPQLWSQFDNSQKKQLLRTLIERVILLRQTPDTVEAKIVWVSGHYSIVFAKPPIHRQIDVTNYDQLVNRVDTLFQQGKDDTEIAAMLTGEGFRSARTLNVTPITVAKIRHKHRWLHRLSTSRGALQIDGYLTVRGLAKLLCVDRDWVYRRINRGDIDGKYLSRHPQTKMYLITNDLQLIEQLRKRLTNSK